MGKIIVITPPHICDAKLALAACRAGELGILDLSYKAEKRDIRNSLDVMSRFAGTGSRWGVRWDALEEATRSPSGLGKVLPDPVQVLVLAGIRADELQSTLRISKPFAQQVFLEVTSLSAAQAAEAAGYDGVVVKGHEAGGWSGRTGSFILLQQLHRKLKIPYWIQGGIGLHTAAAAYLAGAQGAVLCEQLWLTEESPFTEDEKEALARLDGSETVCIGRDGTAFRCLCRSGPSMVRDLERSSPGRSEQLRALARILTNPDNDTIISLGQDIALASPLAEKHGTVGRVLSAFRHAVEKHLQVARKHQVLAPNTPLAQAHGTLYPLVQGPMARISDVAPFCAAVAEAGALPFMAISMMKPAEIRRMLEEVSSLAGDTMSWGVGLLGFLPSSILREQLEVIKEFRPRFAILAGGRPGQADELEAHGTSSYLHVPSATLLKMFIKQGARKFIFEGKECGGHTGPRPSFILWESAVGALLEAGIDTPEKVHILFAGGIHDGLSAAMVTLIAAPLADLGMKVGVVMGTAYLFTHEAVGCGAIKMEYQLQALACSSTVLLESGAGHASRCVKTPFADEFNTTKRKLSLAGETEEEIRMKLETLNLGRLRIAAKGVARSPKVQTSDDGNGLIVLDTEAQRREGLYMVGQVAELRSSPLSISQLHTEVSEGCGKYLEAPVVLSAEEKRPERPGHEEIAIIGMACMLPEASNLREYWQNILNRLDAIREIDEERWCPGDFYSPDRLAKDKTYSKWGGFLKDFTFNPLKYGIPPVSLTSIEPTHLLSLEVAWQALEDAGYHQRDFPRDRTATIFGVGGAQDLAIGLTFRTMLTHYLPKVKGLSTEQRQEIKDSLYRLLPQWTEDSFPGILDNVLAGRIANRLNLGGTNFTVDAACASSMAALEAGIRQLQSHTCDVAVVGAADGANNAVSYMAFSSTQAFSPRGRSFTFDDSADGMVIGEGIAAVILKRLSDAERDGDRIYAVIKGAGSSSDGRNRSLTAPHPQGQVKALRRAYEDAGICPSTVTLIEAHGTGTAIGDRTEIKSLTEVFGTCTDAIQYCAIGSVKSMIGHSKVAAGLASLIKCILALKHRILPPTIGIKVPNTSADFSRSPFYLSTETRPWFGNGSPRRAGVSSFGFGGSNFHMVLEEYEGDLRDSSRVDLSPRDAEIIFMTRDTRADMEAAVRHLAAALQKTPSIHLAQLACSIFRDERKRRRADKGLGVRLALAVTSTEDLVQKLDTALKGISSGGSIKNPAGIYYCEGSRTNGKLCFLFPGQGSQRINMLKDLVLSIPSTHAVFEQADEVLKGRFRQPLSRYIYPIPVFSEEERSRQQEELNDTRIAQPAMGLVNLAAAEILATFGLRPDLVAGHSYGEYVALCAAGSISREELLRISEVRGRAVNEACAANPGTMAAVRTDFDTASALLEELSLNVFPANINGPDQTIIAGPADLIDQAVKAFSTRGIPAKKIPVCAPFHTPFMKGVHNALAAELSRINLKSPSIPVFSNTTTEPYPSATGEIRSLLLRHICNIVQFDRQIRKMHQAGGRIFVEVGPGRVLTSLVVRILGKEEHTALHMDAPGRSGWLQLAHLLSQAAALGLEVYLDPWFEGRHLEKVGVEEAFAKAEADMNPAPFVWRVNCAKASPWNPTPQPLEGAPASRPQPAKSPEAPSDLPPEKRIKGATAPQVHTFHKPMAAANPSIEKIAASSPMSPHRNKEKIIPMKPHANPSHAEREDSPQVVNLPHSSSSPLSMHSMHETMRQFFEVQCEHQKVMQRFFDFHEKMLKTLVQYDGAKEVHSGQPSAELVLPPPEAPVIVSGGVPPAPVLPRLQPQAPEAKSAAAQHVAAPPAATPPVVVPPMAEAASPLGTSPVTPMQDPPAADVPRPRTAAAAADGLSTPAGIPTKEQFLKHLVRLVSERTGFPLDMVDPDLHMEADLGIDSIKKLEIFSSMKDEYEIMNVLEDEVLLEQLAELTTLRSISEWYERNRTKALGMDPPASPAQQRNPSIPRSTSADAAPPGPSSTSKAALSISADRVVGYPELAVPQAQALNDLHPLQADPVNRMVPRCIPAPLDVSERSASLLPSGQGILMIGAASRFAFLLEEVLSTNGHSIFRVTPGQSSATLGVSSFTADFSSLESVRKLRTLISDSGNTIGAIINLPDFEARSNRDAPGQDSMNHAKEMFLILKVFGEDLARSVRSGGSWLVNLSAMDGRFGLKGRGTFPVGQAGTVGLMKSVAREWTGTRVKTIDIDPDADPAFLVEKVRQELSVFDKLVEVGLDEEGRWKIEAMEEEECDSNVRSLMPLGPESVVLVTGGARGITAEITKAMASRYRPHILIVGRTPVEEESPETREIQEPQYLRQLLIGKLRQTLEFITPAAVEKQVQRILKNRRIIANTQAMREAGAHVEYHPLDVRDTAAFSGFIESIYERFGRIDGVIHGAGVNDDRLIRNKSPESFELVFDTKVVPARIISDKLRPEGVKFVVFFSSVAGRYGNAGQSDYSAANEVLNKLAVNLSHIWPAHVLAINWGPWELGGMITEEVRRYFAEKNTGLIPLQEGVKKFFEELYRSGGVTPEVLISRDLKNFE